MEALRRVGGLMAVMAVMAGVVGGLAGGLSSGCARDRMEKVTDAKGALADEKYSTGEKTRLVERMAAEAPEGQRREVLKEIAWKTANGYYTRVRAIELLAEDPTDPQGVDTKAMLRLLIGPEPDAGVVAGVGEIAVRRGWSDLSPVFVRQLSRQRIATDDDKRSEWGTLLKLNPGKSVAQVAFEVFVAPAPAGTGPAVDRAEREREGAWQLLSRLDKSGDQRRAMLASMGSNPSPALADIHSAASQIGAVPLTASELSWLRVLRRPEHAAWWNEATAAVARLRPEQKPGLALRHVEPIRWAAVNEPGWLEASSGELSSMMGRRLEGRTLHLRSDVGGDAGKGSERFADNLKRMVWGDLLALLVMDKAVQTAGLGETLWNQAMEDQRDTTTEYGGFIGAAAGAGGVFKASLYPPRPSQRVSDNRFVASDELLTAGATGLIVYHFHAQKSANSEYAGPSGGDIEYARDSGRLCVVFTPVRAGVFNVDAYFGDGVRCDLGTIGGRVGE